MSLAKDKPLFETPAHYEEDVHAWAFEQARLLRLGRFSELDLVNVIEEIESLGNEQRHALESFYILLLAHLLKWAHQPERRSRSWDATIDSARVQIERREKRSPTLRARAPEIVADAYSYAVREAAKETGLSRTGFPGTCPWTLDELRDPDFLPE
ncbi:DUF29 domain-containing protein [Mangrovibrevibacter kandeliae]|uniref:DUF29 domain-containing protein n=1 Tax=Mangrovibrevibacter kandeliae TaxID=2968473 RepID=UPI0021191B67|nr:DUF29 domain-containing protein [Aurantimonas sp. CSK15Z-1]MCQ8780799.1 DUF29 domain-containing protein [Aurantimonas sp. CSK15Z-1]